MTCHPFPQPSLIGDNRSHDQLLPAITVSNHRPPSLLKPSDYAREREIKAMIMDVLHANASRLEGRKVVLFGSRARGAARPRSDFDLGVVGDQPMPLDAFFAIQDMLEALPMLYHIDWVDLARADEKLKNRALRDAEVLHG